MSAPSGVGLPTPRAAYAARVRRVRWRSSLAVTGLVLTGAALAGAPAVGDTTRRTPDAVVPVSSCPTTHGADEPTTSPIPTQAVASLPSGTAARLALYSNGFAAVLGPRAWSCAAVAAANGGRSLSVFPAGHPDPLATDRPAPDAAGVTVFADYTGHGPGAQLVCSLFPQSQAAALARGIGGCASPPPREQVKRPTPDVAMFRDPPGVSGTGVPSGTRNAASGVVIFPQQTPEPPSVPVVKATCSLPSATSRLCSAIIADAVVRLGGT